MLKAGCGQIPCALNATSDMHAAMPSAHAARMTASSALSNVCSLLRYHHSCKMRVTSGHGKRYDAHESSAWEPHASAQGGIRESGLQLLQ